MNSKYNKPTSRAALSEQELSAAGALWLFLFSFLFSPLPQTVATEYFFFLIKEEENVFFLINPLACTKKIKLKSWKLSKEWRGFPLQNTGKSICLNNWSIFPNSRKYPLLTASLFSHLPCLRGEEECFPSFFFFVPH